MDKKPAPLPPLALLSWSQIVITDTEEYLIEGLLPASGLIVVYGPPKCGKTFWLFDALMSIALGIPYRGRTTKAGKIIYCLFEGQRGFAKRKEAYRQHHQLSDDAEEPPFYLLPVKLELVKDHPRLIEAIRAKCNGTPPQVIGLDTLNRSFTGSESSDEAMTAYIAACDAIREAFGCAVIIVHHSGLAEGRARGHTSLLGSADAQIAVKRDAADNVVATVEFMKDGEDGVEIVSELVKVDVRVGDTDKLVKSCIVMPVDGPAAAPERKLTANQLTMLTILQKAGAAGLSTEDWNDRARDAGLALKRKADLFDFRAALQKKGLIFLGERGWFAQQYAFLTAER